MGSVIHVSQVLYPESDGKPMGETDEHREAMIRHIQILQDYYRGQRVYVSGDLLVYCEQGNPRKYVVPDAFVVKGIAPQPRRIYKTWLEGKAPDVVIETTSRKTRRKDTVDKRAAAEGERADREAAARKAAEAELARLRAELSRRPPA